MKSNSRKSTSPKTVTKQLRKRKLIKILSIDGGGIRGIIPAMILQDIEKKLNNKKHLTQCFDLMSGTSTGGIITLLLNTPDANKKPKFWASDIVEIYRSLGSSIFYQSLWQYFSSFDGWLREKYSTNKLKSELEMFFGNCRLRDALTNIVVPAYDISLDESILFKSDQAKQHKAYDFFFKEIARAATAAPTYFKPARISDIAQSKSYTLVDGGVALNNPTMSACVHALNLFGRDHDYLVISLGTGTNKAVVPGKLSFHGKSITLGGKLGWAPEIVDVLMNATNEIVDYEMHEIFKDSKGIRGFHRFQVLLDSDHTAFDDVKPQNIKALESYARELIHTQRHKLEEIAQLISA
jgi:uncharacterized protein